MPKWFVTCKLGCIFFGIMPSTQLLPVGVLVIMKFNQRRNFSLTISDQDNCLEDCPITNMINSKPKYWTKAQYLISIRSKPRTRAHTRHLKCFVLNTLCSKTCETPCTRPRMVLWMTRNTVLNYLDRLHRRFSGIFSNKIEWLTDSD